MFLLLFTFLFLTYLITENVLLKRQINSIPLRICVTGTRGKSSVVRMLASVLRESGKTVLAKTTGSEAVYILPNGRELPVKRRGMVSILEQKKTIKKAASLRVDVLISEIMSIHPENHFVEAHQILKPDLILITNIRLDHVDIMGKTKEEIASVFCNVITQKSRVFIQENENQSIFRTVIKQMDGKLFPVDDNGIKNFHTENNKTSSAGFKENMNLVYSVAKHLNISEKNVLDGLKKTTFDIGEFKIWSYKSSGTQKSIYLVNGFAANDPESTINLISKLKVKLPHLSGKIIGLLNLRSDRPDRTIQWISAFKNKKMEELSALFVTGLHSNIFRRKVDRAKILKFKTSEKIMNEIVEKVDDQSILFGFGNMKGVGQKLVDYWKLVGEEYGV